MPGTRGQGQVKTKSTGLPTTPRGSPVAVPTSPDPKMTNDQLYDMLKSIQSSMSKMNDSLISLNKEVVEIHTELDKVGEIKASLEYTQSSLDNMNKELNNIKMKCDNQEMKYHTVVKQLAESKMENSILNEKLLQMDTYLRRENLIFAGVQEDKNESAKEVIKQIQKIFIKQLKIKDGNNIDYQSCHRMGPRSRNDRVNRDIIIQFTRFQDRELVWGQRKLLQGTNIVLKEDFPQKINKRRAQLYPVMVAARKDGKKAMLISDKLIIDNQKYTLNNLESLPLKLQPQNLALQTTDKAIMFYGKNCCFSNFYDAKFTLDGITYSSSQQYFQYQKAMRMGNDDIATKIMETSDPVEQHRLGKQVTINKDKWNNKLAKQVMEVGVKGKFEQNPGIRD